MGRICLVVGHARCDKVMSQALRFRGLIARLGVLFFVIGFETAAPMLQSEILDGIFRSRILGTCRFFHGWGVAAHLGPMARKSLPWLCLMRCELLCFFLCFRASEHRFQPFALRSLSRWIGT